MKWLFFVFLGAYAMALGLFAIGHFGLFGEEPTPFAGIFLMPLGLPWTILGDRAGLAGPWLGLLAPAINAAILYWLWRR